MPRGFHGGRISGNMFYLLVTNIHGKSVRIRSPRILWCDKKWLHFLHYGPERQLAIAAKEVWYIKNELGYSPDIEHIHGYCPWCNHHKEELAREQYELRKAKRFARNEKEMQQMQKYFNERFIKG